MIYDGKLKYIEPEKLRFEKCNEIINNELGVATVYTWGTILFEGIEAQTRNINKNAVMFWVEQNRAAVGIPEVQ